VDPGKSSLLHGHAINRESALTNLFNLTLDDEEEKGACDSHMVTDKSKVIRVDDKRYFQICGMDKKEVFQTSVLPVLRTLSSMRGCQDLREILADIIKFISENNPAKP
jgi:hypothetical protein